jgi:hypothetical protein
LWTLWTRVDAFAFAPFEAVPSDMPRQGQDKAIREGYSVQDPSNRGWVDGFGLGLLGVRWWRRVYPRIREPRSPSVVPWDQDRPSRRHIHILSTKLPNCFSNCFSSVLQPQVEEVLRPTRKLSGWTDLNGHCGPAVLLSIPMIKTLAALLRVRVATYVLSWCNAATRRPNPPWEISSRVHAVFPTEL